MGQDERAQGDDEVDHATYRCTVRPEWIDYNGHMNVAYYSLVFDQAADVALLALGVGESYREESNCSVFVREFHIVFDREVGAGAELVVDNRILDVDARRLVLFQEMRTPDGDAPVATNEVLCVHVDLGSRRSLPWPAAVYSTLTDAVVASAGHGKPLRAGRSIGLTRQKSSNAVGGD